MRPRLQVWPREFPRTGRRSAGLPNRGNAGPGPEASRRRAAPVRLHDYMDYGAVDRTMAFRFRPGFLWHAGCNMLDRGTSLPGA